LATSSIFLFGASVRALAFSVLRAGFVPICRDLFGDWDLLRHAESKSIERVRYPQQFTELAGELRGRPWMYTGGLENHPHLFDAISRYGPLWGNASNVVNRIRDPFELKTALGDLSVEFPSTIATPAGLPTDGTWLIKPRKGTGGFGIRPWRGGPVQTGFYWQKIVAGMPCSAVFVSDAQTTLLGVTRQLIGEAMEHVHPYTYHGSIGPMTLREPAGEILQHIGRSLARTFDLRGLWGLDFLLEDETLKPIEVNPRYPASTEILERARNISAFSLHRRIFDGNEPDANALPQARSTHDKSCIGKMILFAKQRCRVSTDAPCYKMLVQELHGPYADVPNPGSLIERGEPIMTLFADGQSIEECRDHLDANLESFENRWIELVPT